MHAILEAAYSKLNAEMQKKLTDIGLLILRIGISIGMFSHGIPKLANFAERAPRFIDPFGIGSEATLALAGVTEIAASIALIIGLFSRLSSLALFFSMGIAVYYFGHELAMLYMLGYAVLMLTGAGQYSADRMLSDKFRK